MIYFLQGLFWSYCVTLCLFDLCMLHFLGGVCVNCAFCFCVCLTWECSVFMFNVCALYMCLFDLSVLCFVFV